MKNTLKIALGGDHAGYECKEAIKKFLISNNYEVVDFGTFSIASVDYPDYVHPLAKSLENKENDLGILFCGSGNGVAITANKYPNIRAALCWNNEVTALARSHNNANILCIPTRFININKIITMIQTFLSTPFDEGRHSERVKKITGNI